MKNLIEANANGLTVFVSPDGLPSATAVIPAPFVSEIEREQRVAKALSAIYLQGYFIASTKRIRNQAFDKRGEKTTTQVVMRACKNKDEAELVASKVMSILDSDCRANNERK